MVRVQELLGELNGYLNVALCIPQLLVSLLGGAVISIAARMVDGWVSLQGGLGLRARGASGKIIVTASGKRAAGGALTLLTRMMIS